MYESSDNDISVDWFQDLAYCSMHCHSSGSWLNFFGALRHSDEFISSDDSAPTFSTSVAFPGCLDDLIHLMGLASYLIWSAGDRSSIRRADARNWLIVYGISLFFNFCWSPVFFDLKRYWFALIWLLALWAMIIYLVRKARTISQPAMCAMVPYLLWVTFAVYLNAGIAILN